MVFGCVLVYVSVAACCDRCGRESGAEHCACFSRFRKNVLIFFWTFYAVEEVRIKFGQVMKPIFFFFFFFRKF